MEKNFDSIGKLNISVTTNDLLGKIGALDGLLDGAYNVRVDSSCASRQSTKNISIENHPEMSGLLIKVKPGTVGEKVYIPACVTAAGIDDVVLNEIFVGDGSDVQIIAGCGVHSDGGDARHSGIHRFHVGKNAKVEYIEKHIGTGDSDKKKIDTKTDFDLAEGATVRVVAEQIAGVDRATRDTSAILAAGATLTVSERLLTNGEDDVKTSFSVILDGEGSKTDVVSRSVARGNSHQSYVSNIEGRSVCSGHTECDAILTEHGAVEASPCLSAKCPDAALIHEAAIGKIAGEQIIKLCTLGLTKEEAEKKIIEGFLK